MGGIRKAMEVRKYSADLNKRKQNECIIYIFLLSIYYVPITMLMLRIKY